MARRCKRSLVFENSNKLRQTQSLGCVDCRRLAFAGQAECAPEGPVPWDSLNPLSVTSIWACFVRNLECLELRYFRYLFMICIQASRYYMILCNPAIGYLLIYINSHAMSRMHICSMKWTVISERCCDLCGSWNLKLTWVLRRSQPPGSSPRASIDHGGNWQKLRG